MPAPLALRTSRRRRAYRPSRTRRARPDAGRAASPSLARRRGGRGRSRCTCVGRRRCPPRLHAASNPRRRSRARSLSLGPRADVAERTIAAIDQVARDRPSPRPCSNSRPPCRSDCARGCRLRRTACPAWRSMRDVAAVWRDAGQVDRVDAPRQERADHRFLAARRNPVAPISSWKPLRATASLSPWTISAISELVSSGTTAPTSPVRCSDEPARSEIRRVAEVAHDRLDAHACRRRDLVRRVQRARHRHRRHAREGGDLALQRAAGGSALAFTAVPATIVRRDGGEHAFGRSPAGWLAGRMMLAVTFAGAVVLRPGERAGIPRWRTIEYISAWRVASQSPRACVASCAALGRRSRTRKPRGRASRSRSIVPVPRRRPARRRRAQRHRPAFAGARPADRRRDPHRRRRQHRRGSRRAQRTRRLHVARDQRTVRDAGRACAEVAALRPDRAISGRWRTSAPVRSCCACRRRCRSRRVAEFVAYAKAQSGQALVCGHVARFGDAPQHRDVQARDRHRDGIHRLCGHPARADRPRSADRLQFMSVGIIAAMPQIKAGKLRPLAVLDAERHPAAARRAVDRRGRLSRARGQHVVRRAGARRARRRTSSSGSTPKS